MRIRFIAPLLLAACLLAVGVATAAPEAPVYDVQIWPDADPAEPGMVVLIAGVRLPTATPLPAKVRIPLPEGAEVTWAGEILGPDPSGDISREITMVAGTGGPSVEFTVSRSRDAQVESLWVPVSAEGDRLSASVRWVQTEPADAVHFSVRMPPGAAQVRIEPPPPRAPEQNLQGERLYTLASKPLKPGEAHTIALSYVPDAAGDARTAAGGPSREVLVAVLGGAVVLLVLLIAVVLRRERARVSRDPRDAG